MSSIVLHSRIVAESGRAFPALEIILRKAQLKYQGRMSEYEMCACELESSCSIKNNLCYKTQPTDQSPPLIATDVKGKDRAVEYDTTPRIALNGEPMDASKHQTTHILEKFKNPAPYQDSEALLDETVDLRRGRRETESRLSGGEKSGRNSSCASMPKMRREIDRKDYE